MSEVDLVHHYRVLKQFLDISDDSSSRNKSNSTRAARAREKLLKLSAAQFRELSTDVYDELKRRIDESRGEPDYLLPKSSFHPKRNQARQKLSSLPQTRFKDLVSDISFEIERRDLHIEKVSTIPESSPTKSLASHHDSLAHEEHQAYGAIGQPHAAEPEAAPAASQASSPAKDYDTDSRKNSVSDTQNQTIGIQSKTVIPTKANLTWSSDEEDPEDEEEIAEKHVDHSTSLLQEIAQKNELIARLNEKVSTLEHAKNSVDQKYRLLQDDYEYSVSQNKSLSDELDSLSEEKRSWINNQRSISQSDDLTKEVDSLKSSIAALRLENQSLKNSSPQRQISGKEYSKTINTSPSTAMNQRDQSIKKDMETFFERLSSMETSPSKQGNSYTELKNDITKWQRKYEEARSNTLSSEINNVVLNEEELKSFVAPYGLISIKLVADMQALVETFLIYLNGKHAESDILFEKISKISILANEIAAQGDNQHFNSNEHSICLREAVSYALSATRYYAVYSSILPKIVVERAVGEICFTLCDLITVAKLNESSSNSRSVDSTAARTAQVTKGKVEEDFGARPLRMASRLRESQNAPENSSTEAQESPFNPSATENGSSASRGIFGGVASSAGQGFLRKISPFGGMRQTSNSNSTSSQLGKDVTTAEASDAPTIPINQTKLRSAVTPKDSTEVSKRAPSAEQSSVNGVSLNEQADSASKSNDVLPVSINKAEATPVGHPSAQNASSEGQLSTSTQRSPQAANQDFSQKQTFPLRRVESPKSRNISALASKFENSPSNENKIGSMATSVSSPNGKGPGVLQMASKLNSSSDLLAKTAEPQSPPARKKNILDKVRQFEVTEEQPLNVQSKASPTQSLHSRKSSLGLDSENDDSVIKHDVPKKIGTLNDPFEAVASVPAEVSSKSSDNINGEVSSTKRNNSVGSSESGKGRGLFQSIRNRLTSESDNKAIDETTNSEEGISDNDKVELSTDKVLTSTAETTPSKEIEDDEQSDYSPVKSDRGFFQSIRDRLATNGVSEDHKNPISSSASDVTVQLDGADGNHKATEFDSDDDTGSFVSKRSVSKEVVPGVKSLPFEKNQPGLASSYQSRSVSDKSSVSEQATSTPAIAASAIAASAAAVSSISTPASSNIKSKEAVSMPTIQSKEAVSVPTVQSKKAVSSGARSGSESNSSVKSGSFSSNGAQSLKSGSFGSNEAQGLKSGSFGSNGAQSLKSGSFGSNGAESLKSSLSTSKRQVAKKVNYSSDTKTTNIDDSAIESDEDEDEEDEEDESDEDEETAEESQARQRQEYRKSMAAATFNVDLFDIDDPDNTLTQVLLYLEHQTVQVISTIQSLLSAIKKPNATRGDLREKSQAITVVISQMTEATNTSMNQTRNAQLKEHGSWVVKSLEDCYHRMNILCKPNGDKNDNDFADKNFKQRLAGISFDIAKCTKELVKTVEEASLKEDIANLDARLGQHDDLT